MVVWCDFISGWISGMAGLVVGHPIDTIKVRQQIDTRSMLQCIKYVYLNRGPMGWCDFRMLHTSQKLYINYRISGFNSPVELLFYFVGFFRGMGVPVLSTGALNSVYFGFYGGSLDQIVRWTGSSSSKNYGGKNEADYGEHFLAGCIGGLAQLFIGCPVDLIKVQLQSQLQKSAIKGPMDCVKQIVKTTGLSGMYRGIVTQAWRDIPASGGYFVAYEYSKRNLTARIGQEPQFCKLIQFVSGGIAGMLSWWSILPLDVIKSRVQGDCPRNPKYKGLIHCGSVILKTHGLKGFFQGFWPLTLRAFPVNGTTFVVYEYLFKHCKESHDNLYLNKEVGIG